jgi:hypothetical protein
MLEEGQRQAKDLGLKESDVDRLIAEYRAEKRSNFRYERPYQGNQFRWTGSKAGWQGKSRRFSS